MKVLELMKSHVIKTSPGSTLQDAVDIMDLYQISGLPVVDSEERLLGVVSEHDVIHALLPEFIRLAAASSTPGGTEDLQGLVNKVRTTTVGEVMSRPAVSVDEGADVLQAAAKMLAGKFKRLPVTSEGRLVGAISRIDICQAALEQEL